MIELIVDSEFEDLFDPKTEGEFSELEKNMIAYGGAYEAIKVWDDNGTYVILDGHHRWKVIQRHPELKYEVQTIKIVTDRLSAKIWILQNALVSKTLSSVRKIEIAEELRPLYEEQAKQRQLRGKQDLSIPGYEGTKGKTTEKIAEIAGVGQMTVHRYETVMKEGTPEQIAAMKSGEKAIKTVYNEIRPPKPKAHSTQSQNEKTDEEGEVDTALSEEKKISIALYRKRHPEETVYWIAKQCGVTCPTVEKYQNYPIPDDYQDYEIDELAGVKHSKLPVETQKAILNYCKDHELEPTGSIAQRFGVDRSSVERLRNHIGQADPSTRSMNKQIAQMDAKKTIYDVSEQCANEYTLEDAIDELIVMKNEFFGKVKRMLEIRKTLVGGNKEIVKLLESFAKDILKELVSTARQKG